MKDPQTKPPIQEDPDNNGLLDDPESSNEPEFDDDPDLTEEDEDDDDFDEDGNSGVPVVIGEPD
jgi:hypothetical protein